MRLSFAPVFLFLSCAAAAQPLSPEIAATASSLRDNAMKGTRAFEIVRSLTLETGPRPAGSAGDRAAVEWGVRTLKELGFQHVRADKVTVPHWERGAESGEILSPWPQPVTLAALGGSVGTPEEGVEAEVVEVADMAALEAIDPARVKGKIVFVNKRMRRAKDGSGYGEAVASRGRGA
ncbi:MAG TPA: peptidase M28 family protein, partial [Thermoanaerobaculia bacterium]|nr:peptidase M28 family protein [Thermoanaerobaculia bacterium]